MDHPPDPARDRPPLVGREREQVALRQALDAALAGAGSLVLIGGEAGIGKTTLAEEVCREAAERGALVLAGHCYDLSETPPYGPWLDLLGDYPPNGTLPPLPPPLAGRGAVGEVASQAALFGQVREFFGKVAAERPLLLLLDDLHWADQASLDLLRFLGHDLARQATLILATYRSDELTRRHPLYQLLPVLAREARATRLDLRRLDEADIRALVAERYGLPVADEARLVGHLVAHAEGNPFYSGELLRSLEEERLLRPQAGGWALGDLAQARLPAFLRQILDGRLARLGEEARGHLAVAAVIGQDVPLDLWATVGQVEEEALLTTVERAVAAHVLATTDDGSAARFAHALLREALYEDILSPRRRGWHRLVAEALLATPTPASGDPDPDALAYHLQRAGDARAGAWLVRAGDRAWQRYAWLTAVERYEAALALPAGGDADARERAALLVALAQLRRYSDPARSVAYLEEAELLAIESGDAALAAATRFDRGHLRCIAGGLRRGLDEMAAALPLLEALPDAERGRLPTLAILGATADRHYHREALALWLVDAGRWAEALALVAPLLDHGIGATPRGLGARGVARAMQGRPDEARRAFTAALAAYRAAGQAVEVADTLMNMLWLTVQYETDRLDERERLAAEAEQAWVRGSGALAPVPPRYCHLPLLVLEGQWDEARQLAATVREVTPHMKVWYASASVVLGLLARERGEATLARAVVAEALPDGPDTAPGDAIYALTLPLLRLAATLAIDAGDLVLAERWLEAHDRWLSWGDSVLGRAEGHLGWAALYRAQGDRGRARERATESLESASAPRQPPTLAVARRCLGVLDTETGNLTEAQEHLAQSLALAGACGARYERAMTLLALAELSTAEGKRDQAHERGDEARRVFSELGAQPALARAEALLAGLVDSPTTPAHEYPSGLSAREVEVLRLVAQGLTNAEVAERLFLSPRTIDQHLRSIYNKLSIANRSAATAFAIDHGLR